MQGYFCFVLCICLKISSGFYWNHINIQGPFWPCRFRGRPWFFGQDGIFFTLHPSVGLWTNATERRSSPSEVVERRGGFFLIKEFGQFKCLKAEVISDTVWYTYNSQCKYFLSLTSAELDMQLQEVRMGNYSVTCLSNVQETLLVEIVDHYTPETFCELCDIEEMPGIGFGSGYLDNLQQTKPITCTIPNGCRKRSPQQNWCPAIDPSLDSGTQCNGYNCR